MLRLFMKLKCARRLGGRESRGKKRNQNLLSQKPFIQQTICNRTNSRGNEKNIEKEKHKKRPFIWYIVYSPQCLRQPPLPPPIPSPP